MLARNKSSQTRQAVGAVALVIVSLFVSSVCCDQLSSRDGTFDDQQQQQQQQVLMGSGAANLLSRHNSRILAVPRSLARFLFYNARQSGGPAIGSSPVQQNPETVDNGGYERSSRALDAISGMTIGKRSANPLDYAITEPTYVGRQNYVVRPAPAGIYSMRWAPLDTIETASGY